jgi:molybdate transport system substrate-binding protein
MKTSLVVAASATVVLQVLTGVIAQAAEVKVLSAVGIREVMLDLGPKFDRATGHTPAMRFDASGLIVKWIEAGETIDVVMILRAGLERLTQGGQVSAGSGIDLASSVAAVTLRQGAPKPDISSPEALKRMLLDAELIAHPDPAHGGASGVHIAKVLDRLGTLRMSSKRKP